VFVEGRLITDPATGGPRLWTRQDGNPAASFEIHADLVQFLGGKNGEANGQTEQPADAPTETEIPF
jgi:single-strand DNA-binding protein